MKEAAGLGLCCIEEMRRRPSLKGDQDIHWRSAGGQEKGEQHDKTVEVTWRCTQIVMSQRSCSSIVIILYLYCLYTHTYYQGRFCSRIFNAILRHAAPYVPEYSPNIVQETHTKFFKPCPVDFSRNHTHYRDVIIKVRSYVPRNCWIRKGNRFLDYPKARVCLYSVYNCHHLSVNMQ